MWSETETHCGQRQRHIVVRDRDTPWSQIVIRDRDTL